MEKNTGPHRLTAFIAAGLVASTTLCLGSMQPASATTGLVSVRRPAIAFRDVTSRVNASRAPTVTFGSVVLDHDLDRDPDFFVNRHWKAPWFYLNRRGSYVKHPNDFKYTPEMDRHACAWGEANGDGRPDLYCTQGANRGTERGANQLLLQKRGGFRNVARKLGVAAPFDRSRTVNWIDYDVDGDLDLFVTNAVRRGYPNRMLRNDRGSFSKIDVGLSEVFHSNWPGSTWADWDDDGDPDILSVLGRFDSARAFVNTGGDFRAIRLDGITDDPRRGRGWLAADWGDIDGDGRPDLSLVSKGKLSVFANRLSGFRRVLDVPLRSGRMSSWLDVDNDGDLDLFVVQGSSGAPSDGVPNYPDLMFLNEQGSFRRIERTGHAGPKSGNGDAVAVSDFDLDGRLDLFVTNGHNPSAWEGVTSLLRNTSRAGNWIRLRLDAGPRNPFGVGVKVRVETQDLTYWRESNDGVSYRAQGDVAWLHLGLSEARSADISVLWPGGGRDCLSVRSGKIKVIERGEHRCAPA